MIIIFYGQPASGKTTLADAMYEELWEVSWAGAIRIDENRWKEITKTEVKNAFDTALFLEKSDYIPILSFVTPYEHMRSYLRNNSSNLVEIYLKYVGDRGKNMNFAIDFEEPSGKYLSIDTSSEDIEESLDKVIEYVFENGELNYEDEI
jgi:adenylylsulfate kinase-like enzyme